jgi:hypothetical protein
MRLTLLFTALVVVLASFTAAHPAPPNKASTTSVLSTSRRPSTSTGSAAPHNSTKTTSNLPCFTGRPAPHNHSSTTTTSNRLPFFTGRPAPHNSSSTTTTSSRRHSLTDTSSHRTHSSNIIPSAHTQTFTGTGTYSNSSSTRTAGPNDSFMTITANPQPSRHKVRAIVRRDTPSGTVPWTSSQTLLVVEVILIVAAVIIVLFGLFVFPGCFGLWGLVRRRLRPKANQGEQHSEWIEMQGVGRGETAASASTPAPIRPVILKQSKVDDLAPGWEDVELGETEVVENRR